MESRPALQGQDWKTVLLAVLLFSEQVRKRYRPFYMSPQPGPTAPLPGLNDGSSQALLAGSASRAGVGPRLYQLRRQGSAGQPRSPKHKTPNSMDVLADPDISLAFAGERALGRQLP